MLRQRHLLTVYVKLVILIDNRVAGQADDPFYVVYAGIGWQTEYNDVAALRRSCLNEFFLDNRPAKSVGVFLDEYVIALQQRRHSRGRPYQR